MMPLNKSKQCFEFYAIAIDLSLEGKVDVRQSIHSEHAKTLDTQALRREFLIENIFVADEYTMVYSHIDRIIVGGIMPVSHSVEIGGEVGKQLGVSRLLDRRELGVINIGGAGAIIVDGHAMILVIVMLCILVKGRKSWSSSAMRRADRRSFITTARQRIPLIRRKKCRLPTLRPSP